MKLLLASLLLSCACLAQTGKTVWLDELDLSAVEIGWGTPHARRSVDDHPLTVNGKMFPRGVGTHAVSTLLLHLDGAGSRFTASVGLDDEANNDRASIAFAILGDRKVLWESGVMNHGTPAREVDIDLAGVNQLGLLVTDAGDGIDYDHADWCDAKLTLTRAAGNLVVSTKAEPYILTPPAGEQPKINGATVFGVRAGSPLLYAVAATGTRPMRFSAEKLPAGVRLDAETGLLTGAIAEQGTYIVTLVAENASGRARRDLRITVGNTIALTPPMGWNSWNCWACAVDEAKVRAAADAMTRSGLRDHGWSYINIDDCWEIKPDGTEWDVKGTPRGPGGMINTNAKFPSMKVLADYVHAAGLKIGIYSGPGPLTCAGFTASLGHEVHDARRYGEWGIDYLKYDWCSYDKIAKDRSLPELKKPYAIMRQALDGVGRDILYSLCQYGMGDVWQWGESIGGNCWRTTGDITDSWSSMATIGFSQAGHEQYAGPGHWNDPDMLVVGNVGWGPNLHPSRLTPDEQYTHISLWCLLSAPLLIGCDLDRLDPFTLNLLSNDEVIEVDQDPLGRQARRLSNENGEQIWVKELSDGSLAVGLFYTGEERKEPADYFAWEGPRSRTIALRAARLGDWGGMRVRDLWRQTDLGEFSGSFRTEVPYHGVKLLRVTRVP